MTPEGASTGAGRRPYLRGQSAILVHHLVHLVLHQRQRTSELIVLLQDLVETRLQPGKNVGRKENKEGEKEGRTEAKKE